MKTEMIRLECLQNYAYSRHIDVKEGHYQSSHKGCSVVNQGIAAIGINKRLVTDSVEYICTLAEEIGHVRTDTVLPVNAYIDPAFLKWLKRKTSYVLLDMP